MRQEKKMVEKGDTTGLKDVEFVGMRSNMIGVFNLEKNKP
jgi:hypothetical protein